MLDAVLFIGINEDREWKTIFLMYLEALGAHVPSHARQVACPPRMGT
jgi:hypothetical protein